ncbi:alpha/beta hydrolase [Nonomuraea angiospora]|uniref:RBBP9/YdeN family alpha/beta hydrolase n=1 Tax=Nonomuraea angiospora TaxID=46172 RepID=UPI0033E57DDF
MSKIAWSTAPTFTAVDATPLRVPGLVVSSDDDPYCSPEAASRLAAGWRIHQVSVGSAGHINSAGGLGRWDSGRALLTAFTAGRSSGRHLEVGEGLSC